MKLDKSIAVVLGVASLFAFYSSSSHAASCMANDTMTLENCPPGHTGPNPQWPPGDVGGDPGAGAPDRSWRVWLQPATNPYPATCASSKDQKIAHARYDIAYWHANDPYADPNLLRGDAFWVKFDDGNAQFFTNDASVLDQDFVAGYNIDLSEGRNNPCSPPDF
ncbi:hypothetical protein ACM9XD_18710 [Xanthomonas sacchari]